MFGISVGFLVAAGVYAWAGATSYIDERQAGKSFYEAAIFAAIWPVRVFRRVREY